MTKEQVWPIDTEWFSDLFEAYDLNLHNGKSLPTIELDGAQIEVGGLCVVHLYPAGRRYLWVCPVASVVEFLKSCLRLRQTSRVFFDIVIREDEAGRHRGLVRAIQGCDPGAPHNLTVIRADSIPPEG